IGINPGLFAAYKGHHYAGPGNHFFLTHFLNDVKPDLSYPNKKFYCGMQAFTADISPSTARRASSVASASSLLTSRLIKVHLDGYLRECRTRGRTE
ncbi:hypothetical protein L9F63_007930, partial [Diploptera punctata]